MCLVSLDFCAPGLEAMRLYWAGFPGFMVLSVETEDHARPEAGKPHTLKRQTATQALNTQNPAPKAPTGSPTMPDS